MSDIDCRNDCALPLRFPRRPGENLLIGHGDDCPCCSRLKSVSEDNRPALSRFNYRIGTYGSIREFLFHHINKTPELQNWTHRAPDDPAVALLEGAAILGDILTFYQETYANEAFLRTAQWRDSIADLVRLLGYRLSPAVGGNAIFAFEIRKDEPVVIPAGFPAKATLEKPPKPSDFETTEEITAYPWLSRFNLYRPLVQPDIAPTTTEFYIKAPNQLLTRVELKPGDRLLMGESVHKPQSFGGKGAGLSILEDPSGWINAKNINAGERALDNAVAALQSAQAALSVNSDITNAVQLALADANAALDSAQSTLRADSEVIELAEKAAEIVAGEAPMRAVNASVGKLSDKASVAWRKADETLYAVTTSAAVADVNTGLADGSAIKLINRILGVAGGLSPSAGVSDEDRDELIAMLRPETDAVETAALEAIGAARSSESANRSVRSYVSFTDPPSYLGAIRVAANIATLAETDSKKAEKAAREAAEKAMRLAAIAASSAAAGASDRVNASGYAKEANDAAEAAKNHAAVVPGDIDAFKDQVILDSVVIGAAYAAAILTLSPALAIAAGLVAAAVTKQKYDAAIGSANTVKGDTEDVKRKTQQVFDSLSDSATKAAKESKDDRKNALDALSEAGRLAGLAAKAADKMAKTRATLISKINKAISKAAEAKEKTEGAVAAINDLIKAIKAVRTEDVREAVVGAGDAQNEATNPARLKNAEIVIVDSIRELHGQKIFKIKGELKRSGSIGELAAFKLGRSFHHFGYNGPPKTTKTDESTTSTATTTPTNGGTTTTVTNPPIPEINIAFSRFLEATTSSDDHAIRYPGNANTTRIVDPPLGKLEFPLEAEVPDIASGTTLVVQTTLFGSPNTKKQAEFTFVRKIRQIEHASLTWGLSTGSVSMVTIDKLLGVSQDGVRYRIADIRDFMLHEAVSPLLTVKCVQEETKALKGTELNYYGTADEVETLKDRRIMIYKPDGEPYLRNVSEVPSMFLLETAGFKQLRRIRLSESVDYGDFPNLGPFADVFGNLVDANEGKRMPEVALGSGDAMQIFQNFKLPKAPLTYHLVSENTPPESPELQIYVDGRQWTRVDSFFGRSKDEQIYIVRQDGQNNSWVQFGDGTTGARLTSGVDNVTAVYRIGDGAFGPLKDDTKVQASAKLKNLDKIQMPMEATGGTEPESGDSARIAAPAKVQSLGRIVSLRDYEAEALAIPGVVSALASWQLRGGVPTVVVTVLMETGRTFEVNTGEGSVNHLLNNYDDKRGAGRNPVLVEAGKRTYVAVSVDYALRSGYRTDVVEPAIRRALGVNHAKPDRDEDQTGLFSLRRRRFGGREYASTVEGWVQNVDGVLWARTTALAKLPETDDPTSIILPSSIKLSAVVTCAVSSILSLYDEHLILKEVAS